MRRSTGTLLGSFRPKPNMVRVTFITELGARVDVVATPGLSLMEAALEAGVEGILAECGGACSCATCHVILDDDWHQRLGSPSELEEGMLEFSENVCERSRLSCQIDVTEEMDGMVVRVGGA